MTFPRVLRACTHLVTLSLDGVQQEVWVAEALTAFGCWAQRMLSQLSFRSSCVVTVYVFALGRERRTIYCTSCAEINTVPRPVCCTFGPLGRPDWDAAFSCDIRRVGSGSVIRSESLSMERCNKKWKRDRVLNETCFLCWHLLAPAIVICISMASSDFSRPHNPTDHGMCFLPLHIMKHNIQCFLLLHINMYYVSHTFFCDLSNQCLHYWACPLGTLRCALCVIYLPCFVFAGARVSALLQGHNSR